MEEFEFKWVLIGIVTFLRWARRSSHNFDGSSVRTRRVFVLFKLFLQTEKLPQLFFFSFVFSILSLCSTHPHPDYNKLGVIVYAKIKVEHRPGYLVYIVQRWENIETFNFIIEVVPLTVNILIIHLCKRMTKDDSFPLL